MRDTTDNRARLVYTPVQTRRAFEEVADQIRGQLAEGLLRPGDRLPSERDLAEQFNLSRNTVREALRSLEVAGVLEFRKGAYGGAFIREGKGDAVVSGFTDLFRLGVITPGNLTEARLIVGVEVTRLACLRATDDDFAALEENVEQSEAAAAADDMQARVDINLAFHALLAQAAKNPLLSVLVDALIAIQRNLLTVLTPLSNNKVILSRRKLIRHMRDRNEEAAVREMQSHLTALQRHYLAQKAKEAKAAKNAAQ